MGLLVELRSEDGEVLARAGEHAGAIPGDLPAFQNDNFPMIKYIDRFGDTVFNRPQMEAVLPELRRLRERARNDVQARVVDGVIELAEKCANEVHLYLWFVGD